MRKGFTLIELLIVISIIIILLAFVLINIRGQIARANDAKRKSDLYTLKNVIEEYNNDHGVFPPTGAIDSCGRAFYTYLNQIPCDPESRNPYGYFPSASTGGYRLCTILTDKTDPAIAVMGCAGSYGCGLIGGYNYCLAQGTTATAVGTADQSVGVTATPTPTSGGSSLTPTVAPNSYACAPPDLNGISYCNYYANPVGSGCGTTFTDRLCLNQCQFIDPILRCRQ